MFPGYETLYWCKSVSSADLTRSSFPPVFGKERQHNSRRLNWRQHGPSLVVNFCDTVAKLFSSDLPNAEAICTTKTPRAYDISRRNNMINIKHRASPFAPFLLPRSFTIQKQLKLTSQKAKMRFFISEIILLLITATAALTGEKIDTSVLKSCRNSEVSLV